MNNKQLGTDFERTMCESLASAGFWVHFITPDHRGAQPFDIIAVKDGMACAIECKTLKGNKKYFDINRLEENQIMAFEKWLACGNVEPLIAIQWNDKVYMVTYSKLKETGKIYMSELKEMESGKTIVHK